MAMRNHWLQKSWKLTFELHDSELGEYVLVKKGPNYVTFQVEVLKNAKIQFNLKPEDVMADIIISELEYGRAFPRFNQILKLTNLEKTLIFDVIFAYRYGYSPPESV